MKTISKPRVRSRRPSAFQLVHIACMCALSVDAACAEDTADYDGDAQDAFPTESSSGFAEQSAAIRNGVPFGVRRGVVEIVGSGGSCTGAMISPTQIITAAHCIPEFLGSVRSGPLNRTISYFDPSPPTGAPGKRLVSSSNERMDVFVKETYAGTGDTQSDLALLVRRSGVAWNGTDTGDYLRISQGTCAQIDRNDLFGRGCVDSACSSSGSLFSMPIDLAYCGEHHFYDLEGSRAVCLGDSGGPYIVVSGGFDLVAGLASNMSPASGSCAASGARQRGVRMNADKAGWLAQKGVACTAFSTNGHPYLRCF